MSALARASRVAFNLVAWLFVACTVIQFYLAGLAAFSDFNFALHREFGYVFGILTLALLVLAVAGRLSRALVLASLALVALFAMQSVFVFLRSSITPAAALHPLNGVLILVIGVAVAWSTRGYLRNAAAA